MLVGSQSCTATLEMNLLVSQKLEIVLPQVTAVLLLDMYLKEASTYKDTCSTMFIEALYVIARRLKQLTCPSTEK